MLIEFKNLSGEQFRTEDAFIHSIYCGSKEAQVLQAFKDYLKARGYQGVKTTKLQFTDEKWCDMEKSK
jgi:hypothetical protein